VFERASLEVFATDKTVTRRFGFVDREHEQGVAFEGFRRHHLTDEFTELIGARMADSAADLPST
jgi:hypothetical protein